MSDFIGLKRLQIDAQYLKILGKVFFAGHVYLLILFLFWRKKIIVDNFEIFRRENSNVWKWTEKESPLKKFHHQSEQTVQAHKRPKLNCFMRLRVVKSLQ